MAIYGTVGESLSLNIEIMTAQEWAWLDREKRDMGMQVLICDRH